MKRWLSLTLVLGLLLLPMTVLAADDNVTPAGQLPIVKEKITLKALARVDGLTEDITTNWCTRYNEEKTNIHIEWSVVEGTDYRDKVNLILTSGADLPDIMINCLDDQSAINYYGAQGLFLPLNDLMDQYGYFSKMPFEYDPTAKAQVTSPDGNIYKVSHYEDCYHCMYSQKMWINQTWLDNLGLKAPTTTDELYEVLKAFKEQDPNGNGVADEVPFSSAVQAWHSNIDGFIMCPFEYNNGDDYLRFDENSKIIASFATEGWRQGLIYMNKLYNEGLMDGEAFTQDSATFTQLLMGDIVKVGLVPGGHLGLYMPEQCDQTKQFVALEPLTGPDGKSYAAYYPTTPRAGESIVILSNCRTPEAAFRWADYCNSEDMLMAAFYGEEGVDWRPAQEGQVGLDGKPAIFEEIVNLRVDMQNKCWGHMAPLFETGAHFNGRAADPDNPYYIEKRLATETGKYVDHVDMSVVVPPFNVASEDIEAYSNYKAQLKTHVQNAIAQFAVGSRDIESEWEMYLEELKTLGLEEYLAICQKSYDAMYR